MILLLLPGLATAAGLSLDTELLRPTFSPGSIPGVDTAETTGKGAFRLGTALQYERDPLVLYQFDERIGAIVSNRTALSLGAVVDMNDWVSLRTVLPLAGDSGTEVPALSADGFGAGDLQIGVRASVLHDVPAHLGAHVDFILPTGRKEAWQGEEGVRLNPGLLASIELGPVEIQTDVGAMVRTQNPTDLDFILGPELLGNGGVKLEVWPDRVSTYVAALSRWGIVDREVNPGGDVAEVLSGLELHPTRALQTDVFVGKGMSVGYGTTWFRVGTALVYTPVKVVPPPPKPKPPPVVLIAPPPPEVPKVLEDLPPPPPPVVWKEDELARIEQDQIVIRDPIQFEFGTDHILPVSMPTLREVAKIMAEHGEVLHIVIEGHASIEGSYIYNFDLSMQRTTAIYKALIDAGVHPERISCRSLGEVRPLSNAEDEESLAKNRRVEFHIVSRLPAGETPPDYWGNVRKPWDGEAAVIPTPTYPPPPPPPAPPPPTSDEPDFFKDKGDEP